MKKLGEDGKVAVRNLRRDANEHGEEEGERLGDITEDELQRALSTRSRRLIDKAVKDIDAIVANQKKRKSWKCKGGARCRCYAQTAFGF